MGTFKSWIFVVAVSSFTCTLNWSLQRAAGPTGYPAVPHCAQGVEGEMHTLFYAVLQCWDSSHLTVVWKPLSELLGLDSPHLACQAKYTLQSPSHSAWSRVTPDSGAVSRAKHSPTPQEPVGAPSFPKQPPKIPSLFLTQRRCWYWLRVSQSWPLMPFTWLRGVQRLGGSFHPSLGLTQRVYESVGVFPLLN